MRLRSYVIQAWSNLWAYKLRSMLAVLGVLVGTASVVALVSGGQLATKHALDQFKGLGINLISVTIVRQADAQVGDAAKTTHQIMPTDDQLLTLQRSSKGIEAVSAYAMLYQPMHYQGKEIASTVVGVSHAFWPILQMHATEGRVTSVLDQHQPMCVLGGHVRQQLLTMGVFLPVKKMVPVGHYDCPVIGVLPTQARNFFVYADLNQSVIVPYAALPAVGLPMHSNVYMVVKVSEHADINQVKADIRQAAFQWFKKDNKMYFLSGDQLIAKRKAQQQTFTVLLGLIGSIALLVGGIGVMNIMLVSVVERRREIGVRMAVGARQSDIRMMFLCESTVLTLFGGVLGIILGVGISWIIAVVEKWSFTFFIWPPVVGFVVSVLVGMFFGYYPAYRASKMDPIVALRTD